MYDPHRCDLPLFRELGLPVFANAPHGEYLYVGKVDVGDDGSYVRLWVDCLPSQFWKAEIYDSESGKTYEVATGSGSLVDFWPSFKMMAQNMLVLESASCGIL